MRIRVRWLDWTLAAIVVCICKALFRTVRIRYLVSTPGTNPYSNAGSEGFIYSVWHDAIAFPIFAGKHVRTVALVSKHHDGSALAYGLKMVGIGSVRGSSKRGGAPAVRELMQLPSSTHFVLTPDGPRGPEHQAKLGMIFLASRTGRAIVPTAFSSVRAWRIHGKWTDLVIPKPFTTVYALSGQPITAPPDASREDLEDVQLRVQDEMDRLTRQAEELADPTPTMQAA
jgi:lysophospholipid acyltransferase (LPLAT)-like uncharacterized protein